jgi:hypothetical protein
LHITRYFSRGNLSNTDLELGLVSVIQHCRKLETFIVEWPVRSAFTPIVDALCTYSSRTLRVLHMHVTQTDLAKLIWTLDSLPSLVALHLAMAERTAEETRLGSAGNLSLRFPELTELSLAGDSCEFVEQALDWELPNLRSFTFHYGYYRYDLPDLVEFLGTHGPHLEYLDIDCDLPVDVPAVLDACPSLTTFSFNPEWRFPSDELLPYEASVLVRYPHPNLTHIGLHQLVYAFGVGVAGRYAAVDPMTVHFARHTNDMNFAALTKRSFPKLTHVRLLNRTMLRDLEEEDGPADECYERWERWSSQCAREHVRLEDCTGNALGYLPELSEVDAGYEDADEDWHYPRPIPVLPPDPISQVQALTRQVRQLSVALQAGLTANMNHA